MLSPPERPQRTVPLRGCFSLKAQERKLFPSIFMVLGKNSGGCAAECFPDGRPPKNLCLAQTYGLAPDPGLLP